ncbi:aminopeptidase P N-terminal domain-containing protein, partial [Bacteroidota bacterium]
FEKGEYVARREKLMDMIPDGIAIIRGATIPGGGGRFYQYNNMMYFTGLEIPNVILLVDGINRSSTVFFTIGENEARSEGISIELIKNPGKFTGVENVLSYDRYTSFLSSKLKAMPIVYTPFNSEELPGEVSAEKSRGLNKSMTQDEWDGRLIRELQFVNKLNERFPQVEVKDCFGIISDLRKIKSEAEIEVMREAGRIGVKAHIALIKATAVNVKESDLANIFEYTCKQEGAQGLAYNTIIMSAENIPFGHYNQYNRILEEGDFVTLDAGADYLYYVVDFSTSFPASGKFTPKQKELYELANAIREVCVKNYRPGITFKDVGQKVREYLIKEGYDPDERRFRGLIRYGGYNHSVGMAVHDGMGTFQGPDEVLREGFVFACDVNMMYPDIEIGVRLEDTVVITKSGCEIFSSGLPRTIEEMEKTMNTNKK